MREYELTYLVSDNVLEADLKKVSDKVAAFITDAEGKISKDESWGRRKLTYPINKQNFATYITLWFELDGQKLAEIDNEVKVMPQIIRHLITLKVEKNEVLSVASEDVVAAQEVENVIGERSFEVVEGQTEESKDLMAKRETSEEVEEDQKVVEETKDDKLVDEKKSKEEIVEEEKLAEPKVEKPKKSKKPVSEEKPAKQKKESKEDESDRIKKLDEKLDELLKDDL